MKRPRPRTWLLQVPFARCGGRCARDARRVSDLLALVRCSPVTTPPSAEFSERKFARSHAPALAARVLPVPVLCELAKPWALDPDRVTRVQPHPPGEVPVTGPEQ